MGWAGATGGAHRQACPSCPISPSPRSCPTSFQQAQLSFAKQERRVLAWERAGAEGWARKGGFGSQRVPRSRAHAHVGGSADGSAGQHRPWRFCFPAANVPTSMGRKEKKDFASAPGLDKAVKSGGISWAQGGPWAFPRGPAASPEACDCVPYTNSKQAPRQHTQLPRTELITNHRGAQGIEASYQGCSWSITRFRIRGRALAKPQLTGMPPQQLPREHEPRTKP